MFEHVSPAARPMPADTRDVLLFHDRSHLALLYVLGVLLVVGSGWLGASAAADL